MEIIVNGEQVSILESGTAKTIVMFLVLATFMIAAGPQAQPVLKRTVAVDPKTGMLGRRTVQVLRGADLDTRISTQIVPRAKRQAPPHVKTMVHEVAKKHDVDPDLVTSVMAQESAFQPTAVSHAGAMGLMQLMPATARRFGVSNPFDPRQNLEGGVKYLKYLQGLFGDNLELTLAAYNAGENAVAKYGNRIPPYRETVHYVSKIASEYRAVRNQKQATAQEAVPSVVTKPVVANPESEEAKPRSIEWTIDEQGRFVVKTRAL